jgi:hypothetical protein
MDVGDIEEKVENSENLENQQNITNNVSVEGENDQQEETPLTAGLPSSGSEIGPSATEEAKEIAEEDDMEIFLGDRVRIYSKKYGKVEGYVYYLDFTRMLRVLPYGVSNMVYEFPLEQVGVDPDGDPEYDFEESLGVDQAPELLGKGPRVGFAKWLNFQVGQDLETINKKGDISSTFTITNIDYENDRIRVKIQEEGRELDIDFNEKGYEDEAHDGETKEVIIRVKVQPEEPSDELIMDQNVSAENLQQAQEDLEENFLEENIEFEIKGTFEVTAPTQMIDQPEYERVYPEIQQKNEMLEDLLSILDKASQRNPAVLKNIRTLVEMSSMLKNSVVARDETGIPVGEKKVSIYTLNDIFLNNYVPVARPVLDTKRVLVSEANITTENTNIVVENLESVVDQSIKFLQDMGARRLGQRAEGELPAFFGALEDYFKNFPLGDKYATYGFQLPTDMEYFRKDAPDQGEDIYGLAVLGTDKKSKDAVIFDPENILDWVGPVQQSLRRGHGPTMMPFDKHALATAIPADKAPLVGQVLFPYSSVYTGAIGSTRTGKLWDDILRSNVGEKIPMAKILEMYGGVSTDTDDISNIMFFKSNENIAMKTPFDKYLELILKSLILKGPGDINTFKADLGIEDYELNTEQQKAVSDRILEILASVRSTIAKLRQATPEKEDGEKQKHETISQEFYAELRKKIEEFPDLKPILDDFDSRIPSYSIRGIDIALFAYMFAYIPDYLIAILGNNKQNMVKEYQRFKRNAIMKKLQEEQKYKILQRNRGQAPKPNPCKHVEELTACRRVRDPIERNKLLVELLKTFQGLASDNWIQCQACKQNFICRHELLQLQQFMNPKEFNVIQKKIILDFAGGAYGRKHICKNCGEGIEDIDFDKHVEFSDDGVPRQDLLFDKEEERQRVLTMMLGVRVDPMDEISFETAQKTELYRIIKVIEDEIGISLVGSSIREIVDRADGYVKLLPSEDDYIEQMKGKRALSYGQYLAQHKIAIVASLVLVEIQTRIPTYMPKFVVPGCDPSFSGYPLDADADPQNPEQIGGIKYIGCVLSTIVRNDNPWVHGFQFISSEDARKKRIINLLISYTNVLTQDITIQHLLATKRRHILVNAQVKQDAQKHEKIPDGFLPKMETAAEALENAAREPTVNEGANGALGEVLKADKWIRVANGLIRETANIIKGSPYTESSCCFDSIATPGKFWIEAQQNKLPPMPKYTITTPLYVRSSYLYTQLQIRPLKGINVELPIYLAYQLLLKVCYRGPRIGLPHEIGYDHKCDWCDLKIPTQVLYPDVDVYGNPIYNQEELKSALDMQQITLDEIGFQKLLDDIHRRTEFLQYIKPVPKTPDQILQRLGEIAYEPIPDFAGSLQKSKENLISLQDTTSKTEIQRALVPLRQNLNESEAFLIRRFGDKGKEIFASILRESPQTVFEILLAYFLTPAQRILQAYNGKGILRVPAHYKLGPEHKTMLKDMFDEHISYLDQFDVYPEPENDEEEDRTLLKARLKLAIFVEQLSEIHKLSGELRVSRMKFDPRLTEVQVQMFFNQIIKTLVLGPIGELANPAINPESPDGATADPANSDQFLIKFVSACLVKYRKESVAFNPEETKQKIAEAKELEAQRFVRKLDKLTPEERQIELQKKKYGYGDWAIGGTKLVYSYDADQWVKNTEAAQMDYATASGFTPEADLPIDITDMDLTGYVDREGMAEQGLGYEYKLYDEDEE